MDNIGENFTRLHLLEKSDIRNIDKEFGIKDVQRHPNDQMSVLSLIKELGESEGSDSPILYYKTQGQIDPKHKEFTRDDFMIVIQTKAQRERAIQFGNDGVCCDATHGTTIYDFLLTTLLVIDEFGEGQPIGWCLSNKEDEEFLKVFFKYLKESSGRINPVWFMADIAAQSYNAFCSVMQCKPRRLYCTWHVLKAWRGAVRENVHVRKNAHDKIEQKKNDQADIYQRLVLHHIDILLLYLMLHISFNIQYHCKELHSNILKKP